VLHGRVVYDTVASAALGLRRGLTVYIPPQHGTAAIADVIYMADGQSLPEYAPLLDTLILIRRLPRLLVVGINSDPGRIMPDPAKPGEYLPDGRSREYLPGVDSTRFAAHERFLLDEVLPHVERTYGAPSARNRRALFGFSNGATFGAAMGLSHPDRFGAVIAFSPGGGAKSFAAIPRFAGQGRRPVRGPKLYVSGGMYEASFLTNARALAELFRVSGAPTTLREPAGGHDEVIWQLSLPAALRWTFRSHVSSAQ
jgi:enterochelin esterase-like enzyme